MAYRDPSRQRQRQQQAAVNGRRATVSSQFLIVPSGMRAILISSAIALAACGRSDKPKANEAYDPRTRSPFRLDTGQTIATGESRYAIIKNDSCPGIRIANTRFAATRGLIIRITEDNSQLECTEGIISRGLVLVWHEDRPSAPPDTIHAFGASLSLVSAGTNANTVPLLDAVEEVGGIGPELHGYYSLLSGKQLFISEPPILMFVANGTRRYLSVRGGDKDTAVFVEYGSGASAPEVLRILSGRNSPWGKDPVISADSVSLDGPRRNDEIVIGPDDGKDSVVVSGITLRLRAGDVSSGFTPEDAKVTYVVRIVNDRLVLDPAKP
jgi:hypothetical protein